MLIVVGVAVWVLVVLLVVLACVAAKRSEAAARWPVAPGRGGLVDRDTANVPDLAGAQMREEAQEPGQKSAG